MLLDQELRNLFGASLTVNQPLAPLTTYKIGGPAQYFINATDESTAIKAVQAVKQYHLPLFILGGGSNILVADEGYNGLVLRLNWHQLEINSEDIVVSSRVLVSELVEKTLNNNLRGLECLAGVPGEVGGAIRGNAGTFGQQIGDYVTKIIVVTLDGQKIVLSKEECGFGYRDSRFKNSGEIIISAALKLVSGDGVAGKELVKQRLERRWATQPPEPSAGCIFKNIPFSEVNIDDLRRRGVDIDKFKNTQKIPTAYLIESLGLKGRRVGNVQVSTRHANFLVNLGGGTAKEVCGLIDLIKKDAQKKYSINLIEEIQKVGF